MVMGFFFSKKDTTMPIESKTSQKTKEHTPIAQIMKEE